MRLRRSEVCAREDGRVDRQSEVDLLQEQLDAMTERHRQEAVSLEESNFTARREERASLSDQIDFEREQIREECIAAAQVLAKRNNQRQGMIALERIRCRFIRGEEGLVLAELLAAWRGAVMQLQVLNESRQKDELHSWLQVSCLAIRELLQNERDTVMQQRATEIQSL